MLDRPPGFDDACRGVSTVAVRVELLVNGKVVKAVQTGDGQTAPDLPLVSDGSVRSSRSQFERSQVDLTIAAPALAPLRADALLNVTGTEIRVWRGLFMPDRRPVLLPLGTFGISSVDWTNPTAGVHVQGIDRGQRISRDGFEYTRQLAAGSAIGRIQLLTWESLRGVLPGVDPSQMVDVFPGVADIQLPDQQVESNRSGHLTDVATSMGCEYWLQPLGTGLIRPIPDAAGAAGEVLRSGDGGDLTSYTRTSSNTGVYNSVRVTGQSTSGTSPDAISRDYDPGSQTRWTDDNSGFGHSSTKVSKPELLTNAQCQVVADALIAESRGAARSIDFGAVVNPARQCSDVVRVLYPDGTVEQHVIDSLTTPIVATSGQTGQSRAVRSGVS